MDVFNDLTNELDGIADDSGPGFQNFDMGAGVQQGAGITRADLRELEHRLLSAIAGNITNVPGANPRDDLEQDDQDAEELASVRLKARRWSRSHG
jgi:hypothetical protein